ncbi:MAG: hypothetical protein KatS3mg110_1230 [Pirellulaceae bacterium]|nr:MAG: hypothetical protein KatS3mg110_1230 [Pirellulaceae bacterium]
MRIWAITLVLSCALCGIPLPLAQAWDGWHRFWSDWHRANAWPQPYASCDRQLAYAALEPFVQAGWQTETTLLDPLFDAEGQLTRAGKLRVREILIQYPPHRRMLFVAPADDPQLTERRVESVKNYLEKLPESQGAIPVAVNHRIPRSGTGDYLNLVGQRYRQSMPAPVLPSASSAGGSTSADVSTP